MAGLAATGFAVRGFAVTGFADADFSGIVLAVTGLGSVFETVLGVGFNEAAIAGFAAGFSAALEGAAGMGFAIAFFGSDL
ncbi:MAG TPA: hypothetical protein VHE81_11520 [Lacipirellulaceae bacterium]|nr:hypothetical protein [Lacipirellulaceae bacterium]